MSTESNKVMDNLAAWIEIPTSDLVRAKKFYQAIFDVEMIDMKDINTAYKRVMDSDVKYRFVIDMKSLNS